MAKYQALEMRYSSELAIWRDIMQHGGARLTVDTPGKAINVMMRLNRARSQLRGRDGVTDYDAFSVTRAKDNERQIVVQPRLLIEYELEPLHAEIPAVPEDLNLETEDGETAEQVHRNDAAD